MKTKKIPISKIQQAIIKKPLESNKIRTGLWQTYFKSLWKKENKFQESKSNYEVFPHFFCQTEQY